MMSKDYLDISSHDKNMQKFPARISSKVPVQIAMHSRNNSAGYEGHHSYKTEKGHDYDIPLVKPIAINALRNPKDESLSGSYHSYFSLGQTPSNSSTSSSTTLKTYFNNNNNNNSTDYPFKFDEDDFPKYKNTFDNKIPVNSFEYNESVTMAVLNSEGYSNNLGHSGEESPEFEFNKDLRGYSKSYNDKDVIDIKTLKNKDNLKSYTLENNNSKSKEDKMYKKLVNNEMIFSPDDSPIIIPDKPSNKVDMSKSVLFKNSNSSTDSLSSNGSYGKKRVSLKKARNSINLSRTRSSSLGGRGSGRIDYDEYPIFNLENHPADVRSYSLPRRSIDIHKIDTSSTTRSRSNTLPRSLIISPAKDEKFFICSSPRKDSYNIQDIPAVRAMEYEKRNNYKSYDDDKGSFVYNQSSELISPSVCDVAEYRNFLKSKSYDMPDASEERKHRSLSRRRESRYRSLSRGSENEKSERRSKSKTKTRGERQSSPVKNMDDESRYRSLSRSRKDSRDDERVEKIERERQERMDKEHKEHKENKERRRSSSKHKKHRKNKSSSNHDSPLVKSSPIVRNNSRGSNVGSPLIKKEARQNNIINSSLVRKNSRGSNVGSPLVIKESYSSPLNPSSMNSKFSTSYIQNEYNKSQNNIKSDYPNINNSDDDEDHKITRTIGETQNIDIINEICDLKKFSQDFSSLNILESILNRPIEDDFEFLNYNKPENQKYSTLTRLPSQGKRRSKSRDIKRRNSDMDYNKGHHRASSDQLRGDDNGKGSKRNIFNFFSHKKSKSYSSSPEKSKAPDFDKMIKGNETLKLTLQPGKVSSPFIAKASIDGYSSDSDSDINNEEYSTSYKNFLKEKMMNQQQNQYNQQQNQYNQPISNIKDYTPLFRINMVNNTNNKMNHHMDFYGAKKDIPANPYDQFNDFSIDEGDRRSFNNKYSSLGRYNKHGSKRMNYKN